MSTRLAMLSLLVLLATTLAHAQQLPPPLTFHASFDGTLDAAARGDGKPVQVDGPVAYRPGKVGQALLCGEGGAALEYHTAGNLRAAGGTVEMWVCPLDWTGQEDEFHVFLEAMDPGWLVFYRYYQGGILTLAGTDGGHYTAAAGPPIRWKPGEWHHLVGTWRARRLEVYVDGQRAGVAAAALLPEKLGEVFHLGDRPWHVARQRQTLLDEVKIYAAPLDAESIALAAKGQPIAWQPQMLLDYTVDPDANKLRCNCDATGLVGDLGKGRKARVEIAAKGQATALVNGEITSFPQDIGQCELALGSLAAGEYEVRAVLLDEAGAEVARTSLPLNKPGPPVWSGNQLGLADKVQKPWTPLVTDRAKSALDCWGRHYQFGPLLAQATSAQADLLSRPVTLEAVIGGKVVPLNGAAAQVDSASLTRTTLVGLALGGGLSADLRHEVEYDGFTWTDVTIAAREPVQVDELRLTWSMPRAQATLFQADRLSWSNNPAGELKAAGWTSPFVPCFWVGNEDRGLSWYAESTQNWVTSKDLPTIEVKPQGDQVAVTIRLLAAPTPIDGKRQYGFGLMATPTRPRPRDAMRWRMTPGVFPTFDIVWPNGNMKYYGYPDPIDPAKFKARVEQGHAQQVKTVPYINLNYASGGIPEWAYYQSRWADPDRIVTPSDVAAMGYASCGTCPSLRDWQDFILYRINEMIDRYQVDGIYIDCWGPMGCRTAPCGWVEANGKRQPTYPVRAYRQILKRVYTLFRERRPDPLLMLHLSTEMNAPMISFADTVLDGEQFSGNKLQDDYVDLLPPDMIRAEMLGRNHGPVCFFLPEFRGDYAKTGTPNLAAYLLLHGLNAWPIWSDAATWNKLYNVLDAFDLGSAKFLPYWQSPSWAERPPDLASAYLNNGQALLVDMNTLNEPGQAKLTLDLKRLEMKSLSSATDVLSGEQLKLEGNVLTIPQAPHQGRIILLRP